MTTGPFLVGSALFAFLAPGVSAVGLLLKRPAAPPSDARGGPYRSNEWAGAVGGDGTAKRLGALGSIILSMSAVPALGVSLSALRWEGIGVTLLAAIGLALARLHGAVAALRTDGVNSARLLARASLLFDAPVAVFAVIHIRFVEDGLHDSVSLAAVAGAFAVVDGLQAGIVLQLLRTPRPSR